MDSTSALDVFSALSQATRLAAFRLIMGHAPHGLAAGEVARRLGVPQNTLSTHLGILERVGLLCAERQSRSIIYRAELDRVRALTSFLVQDCCGGHPDLCAPLVAEFAPCCTPPETAHA